MSRENRDYKAEIVESSKELTTREKIKFKDVSDAIKLDDETQAIEGGKVLIDFDFYVRVHVHNEKSENTDYDVTIYVDKNGNKYISGSESLFNQFIDIYDEMTEADEEDFQIIVYRKPSKNRSGKDFLTCTIA